MGHYAAAQRVFLLGAPAAAMSGCQADYWGSMIACKKCEARYCVEALSSPKHACEHLQQAAPSLTCAACFHSYIILCVAHLGYYGLSQVHSAIVLGSRHRAELLYRNSDEFN